jgi:LAO/AO transport system kinase
VADLVEELLRGDERAVARAISMVEENAPRASEVVRRVFSETGRATVVGVTGAPGAGKSSLVDRLVASYRATGSRVGVIAVDPSSAYSGGAILGDRVRMMRHATDEGVFIRSMATRGHLGGLARAASDAVDLLDAAGFDPIILETVGVGQDEVDVVRVADAVCVVLVPGMGDDIQAIKAGILEIADMFVINKADQSGVDRLIADLRYMLNLVEDDRPRPEILRTVATAGEGITELREGVARFLDARGPSHLAHRRRERADGRFRAVLSERAVRRILDRSLPGDAYDRLMTRISKREIDPYSAVDEVLSKADLR